MTSDALLIGTLATPALLKAPFDERQALCNRIVEGGIDHVFVADHVSFFVGAGMDGLINAATITALHPKLTVCVGVYLLALRHPVPVARQLATIAESAPGRLILGVGVGGEDRNEIAMCGVDPATRGRRTNECLHVLENLLSGAPLNHDGDFFSFEKAWIQPAPVPRVPIVIGGRSDAALTRAARYGDGWLAVWCSARRFHAATAQVDRDARALGRPQPTQHGLQVWVGIDDDAGRARARLAKGMEQFYRIPFKNFEKYSPSGTASSVADFLKGYRDAGARLFNIMPVAASDAAGIDAVAEIASQLRR